MVEMDYLALLGRLANVQTIATTLKCTCNNCKQPMRYSNKAKAHRRSVSMLKDNHRSRSNVSTINGSIFRISFKELEIISNIEINKAARFLFCLIYLFF